MGRFRTNNNGHVPCESFQTGLQERPLGFILGFIVFLVDTICDSRLLLGINTFAATLMIHEKA